jgi:heptosyltransferase-3
MALRNGLQECSKKVVLGVPACEHLFMPAGMVPRLGCFASLSRSFSGGVSALCSIEGAPGKILILRGGALGDFVLTLPAIGLLRSAFPQSRMELIAHPRIASLAKPPYVERVLSIENAALAPFFSPNSDLDSGMAAYFSQFDLTVSYLSDPEGVFESRLRQCGVSSYVAAFCVPQKQHAVWEWASALSPLGLYLQDPVCRICLTAQERECARMRFALGNSGPRLALHPGSGSARKNWPVDRWMELAGFFLENCPDGQLLIVGGEADQVQIGRMRAVLAGWGPRVGFVWDEEPRLLAALLEQCHLFVGHDSGVSHVAAAVQTPCLLLFGPTDPEVWAPPGRWVRVIQSPDSQLEGIPLLAVQSALLETIREFNCCHPRPDFLE